MMRRIMGIRLAVTTIVVAGSMIATEASATKPVMPRFYEGCVFEGFLIPADQRVNHNPLPVSDKVDWKKLEGKRVNFSLWVGKTARRDDFSKEPEVVGSCDLDQHKVQLAYAWFSEAVVRMGGPSRQGPLPAIDRSLALDPGSCDAATLRAFALEKAKRRAEAIAQLNKAVSDMKCGYEPAQRLNEEHFYETKLPIGSRKK